jgi:hypothetical protein
MSTTISQFIFRFTRNEHADKNGDKSKMHTFIGAHTFIRFMHTFWHFFSTKAKQCENDIIRLRRVLGTLTKTREGAVKMKNYIKELRLRCRQAEKDSEEMLKDLIDKTTVVEKLKARFGKGSQLAALMQMQEDGEVAQSTNVTEDKLIRAGSFALSTQFLILIIFFLQ